MGDVINTLPALEAIRTAYPQAFIGWMVEDRFQELLVGHPSVNCVHVFPRRKWQRSWRSALPEFPRFLRGVRRARYDLVLDFQSNFKSAVQGVLSGVPRRVGFGSGHCKERSHWFTNLHVFPRAGKLNRVEKNLAMAEFVGASGAQAQYRLPSAPDSERRVNEFLLRMEIPSFAIIHPGSSARGSSRRWKPDRFSALARRIGTELGLRTLVTWGPLEADLADLVAGSSSGWAARALPTPSLLDLAELVRRAAFIVGCDTGPLRLASAVNTPSVTLYGPTDPVIYGPYSPSHRVVFRGVDIEVISVDDVFGAVTDLLPAVSR